MILGVDEWETRETEIKTRHKRGGQAVVTDRTMLPIKREYRNGVWELLLLSVYAR